MILRTIGGHTTKVLQLLQQQFGDQYLYTWNSYNHDQDWALQAYAKAIQESKTLICAETPLIGRKLFDNKDDRSYYRIGINAVSTQQFHNFNLPQAAFPDRLEKILSNTNTVIKPWRETGEHILYAMQVPADSSLSGLDIFAAAQYDLIQIRQVSSRPIKITLHPDLQKGWAQQNFARNNHNFEKFKTVANLVGATLQIGGSHQALENCWCTVCYTSGFGFDSIAEGIPVITLSNRSFVSPLCSNTLYEVENPRTPNEDEKTQWLSRVAYCQWAIDEIMDGSVYDHFSGVLNL